MPGVAEGIDLAEILERLVASGVGFLGDTVRRADSVVGGLAGTDQLGERVSARLHSFLDDLGFVRREQVEELELKIAQLEHRIRLLEESGHPGPSGPGA